MKNSQESAAVCHGKEHSYRAKEGGQGLVKIPSAHQRTALAITQYFSTHNPTSQEATKAQPHINTAPCHHTHTHTAK